MSIRGPQRPSGHAPRAIPCGRRILAPASMVPSPVSTVADAGGITPEHTDYLFGEVFRWQNVAKRFWEIAEIEAGEFTGHNHNEVQRPKGGAAKWQRLIVQ